MATNRISRSISSPSAQIYLQADELSYNAAANTHVVRCYLRNVNRGNTSTNYQFGNATVTGRVNGNEFHVTGSQANFGPGVANGGEFWRRGPFDITITGNPDGTAEADVSITVNYPNASGGGTTNTKFALTTLRVAPGVPSGLSFVRNSDTQATLGWTNNHASNGVPTSNQVRTSVNGAAYSQIASVSPTTSLVVGVGANQKIVPQVRATNSAGSSAWSTAGPAVYTTPAAPTGVAAAKQGGVSIMVTWTPNVAFAEHEHLVEHGTVLGGVTTWDGSPAAVPGGSTSLLDLTPDPSKVHVYRVWARNTGAGALESSKALSNQVLLVAPPARPTTGAYQFMRPFDEDFLIPWHHNPVDTTAQTAYEITISDDGGSTWTSSGKVVSTVSTHLIPASTYPAGTQIRWNVRTWGQATSGGSDGTGASPWMQSPYWAEYRSKPTTSVVVPASSSTVTQSALTVDLNFSQPEGAAFVRATVGLYDGATLLEEKTSTALTGILFDTSVEDGKSYTVQATVLDSNGITSASATSTFNVAYTLPVTPVVDVAYLPDSGWAQLDVTIPPAGVGEVDAVEVTIRREVDGVETLFRRFPVTVGTYTFLDTTPVVRGTNVYTVIAYSNDGASVDAVETLETTEDGWAFLSSGDGFGDVIRFRSNLRVAASPSRATTLVEAAGRERPIALFGVNTHLEVSGSATVVAGEGSSVQDIERFLLTAGIVCYRDPSGRRVFGTVTGSLESPNAMASGFQFRVVRADA